MASSDSDPESASTNVAEDARIEQCLRALVIKTFASDADNLTLKRIRTKAEAELDLEDGYLKADAIWKTKSKDIVADELSTQENASSSPQVKEAHKEYPPADSPVDEKSLPSRPQKPAKRNSGEDGPDKKKRRKVSGEGQKSGAKSRKTMDLKLRQVKASPSSDDEAVALAAREEVEGTESRNATPDPQKQRKKRPTIESSPAPASTPPPPKEESEAQDDELENSISQTKGAKPTYGLNDESDLSSLEDDSPPPKAKQRKRKSGAKEDKPSKVKFPKAEAKGKLEATPQGAAVKKLQGQLAKCGVRKVWGNYLKNYETPKQKIAHLRSMLEDVGMTGRFSEDKARQIKEERELKADIDAITEGEKKWGKAPEETGGKRLAKGLQELEGLVDEDGESE